MRQFLGQYILPFFQLTDEGYPHETNRVLAAQPVNHDHQYRWLARPTCFAHLPPDQLHWIVRVNNRRPNGTGTWGLWYQDPLDCSFSESDVETVLELFEDSLEKLRAQIDAKAVLSWCRVEGFEEEGKVRYFPLISRPVAAGSISEPPPKQDVQWRE